MTPQTVTRISTRVQRNQFPAAILQPPFFDPNADDAVNYGGIGGVIGHEIGHGFDDQGRLYDATGKLEDWWTKADGDAFTQRSAGLVAQYSAFEMLPGLKVNGQLTLGENIGDLGGMGVAYQAYKRALGGKEAPVVDGLTGDQRFSPHGRRCGGTKIARGAPSRSLSIPIAAVARQRRGPKRGRMVHGLRRSAWRQAVCRARRSSEDLAVEAAAFHSISSAASIVGRNPPDW